MLAVIGLEAQVGRKQVASAITHRTPGPRLLVEFGVAGSTWALAAGSRPKPSSTLATLYDELDAQGSALGRVRVRLETVLTAITDLETGRGLAPDELAERSVIPVVRAPTTPPEAAERGLRYAATLAELFSQLERAAIAEAPRVVVDLGRVTPSLVGQAPWLASVRDAVLVVDERTSAIAALGYFERAFPQVRLWVVTVAHGRSRRRRLDEVVRFALRTRTAVGVVPIDRVLLTERSSPELERALAPIVAASSLALHEDVLP